MDNNVSLPSKMKNFFIIISLMISLTANSQARLVAKSQEIYDEFKEDGIKYITDKEGDSCLLFYPDPNVTVQYYFGKDSICTDVLIQTFTQEMTDFIIGNYTRKGYLKVDDGWLMRGDYGIYKIVQMEQEDGSTVFLWY